MGGKSKGKGSSKGAKEHKGDKDCKLHVSQLSWKVNWHRLKEFFEEQGYTVEFAKVMREDSPQGKHGAWSRGWGIVELGSVAEVKKAIKKLNGADLDGREIKVKQLD